MFYIKAIATFLACRASSFFSKIVLGRTHRQVHGRIVNGMQEDPTGGFCVPDSPRFVPLGYQLMDDEYDHGVDAIAVAIFDRKGRLVSYICNHHRLQMAGINANIERDRATYRQSGQPAASIGVGWTPTDAPRVDIDFMTV